MSSPSSPCAACKFLRRKCTQECVFAPYFPPDQPQKFANVHKVFGASNVAKLLNDLSASQREDAVNSLAYEAEARLNDPVYGCVGVISILQHRLKQMQIDLLNARKELATYIGPTAMLPIIQHPAVGFISPNHQHHQRPQTPSLNLGNSSSSVVMPYNNMQALLGAPARGGAALVISELHHPQQLQSGHHPQQLQSGHHPQQQMIAAHQMAVASRDQELFRSYEEHQHEVGIGRFAGGFPASQQVVTSGVFHRMSGEGLSQSLALGSYDIPYHQLQQRQEHHPHTHGQHHQHQLQPQHLLQQQQSSLLQSSQQHHQQQLSREGSDKGRSIGPSC